MSALCMRELITVPVSLCPSSSQALHAPVPPVLLPDWDLFPVSLPLLPEAAVEPYCGQLLQHARGQAQELDRTCAGGIRLLLS